MRVYGHVWEYVRRYSFTHGYDSIMESLTGTIIAGDVREIVSHVHNIGVTWPWTCLMWLVRTYSWQPLHGFKLQVTAMPGFYSLFDWCYQIIQLFWLTPDNREDVTVYENRFAKVLYSMVKHLVHGIRTGNDKSQLDTANWIIRYGNLWAMMG